LIIFYYSIDELALAKKLLRIMKEHLNSNAFHGNIYYKNGKD